MKNDLNYKTPQIVPKLTKGPVYDNNNKTTEYVSEIPSTTDYYDGAHKLNTVEVSCKIYVSMKDCLHQSGCGWCRSPSRCVMGNQLGPLETCAKSSYIFTTGSIHEERVVQENVGSLAMTIVQK